ncbi:hypothetical protein ALI144C_02600 [Actinosynnema sp. ALI-1.44]|uniref:hypothetical protein n=1 Tax=Actinosynnema sp. ALI-1.44 TaxID=1933779 RepID=UPI00097C9DDC|nr:hypothetical protein [Actinosynnema sp. ALI-1.44]ONI90589.1 hypothetical protein ALI144C_02600 [Actinosynnema sp. ALI-1.44]
MLRPVLFGAISVGVVGLFMAGPVAHADSGDAKLYFSKHAVPGGAVELSGICHADKAMAYSNELEPHAITLVRRNNMGDISANAKVGKNVKPGIYQVRFDCGDTKQHVQIEIEPVQQQPSKPTTGKPAPAKPEAGQVAVKPKGAANTGEVTWTPLLRCGSRVRTRGCSYWVEPVCWPLVGRVRSCFAVVHARRADDRSH